MRTKNVCHFAAVVAASLGLITQPARLRAEDKGDAAARRASAAADLARLKEALTSGKLTTDTVMASTDWSHLRESPEFRKLILDNTRSAKTTVAPSDEPGTPLMVSGLVRDEGGSPVAGALVYVFQTSANGSYSTRGGNAADMGDSLNPRLFGYMKTGADGRYEFRTIRPGQYPNDGPPAHIHYEISAAGMKTKATELMFEGDTRMTPATKQWAVKAGFVVQSPVKGADGLVRITADWTLARE